MAYNTDKSVIDYKEIIGLIRAHLVENDVAISVGWCTSLIDATVNRTFESPLRVASQILNDIMSADVTTETYDKFSDQVIDYVTSLTASLDANNFFVVNSTTQH